jgi:hypothetical protein
VAFAPTVFQAQVICSGFGIVFVAISNEGAAAGSYKFE